MMKNFFAPMGVFIVGQLVVLFIALFLPAIGTIGDQLAADSAAMAPTFWGWSWVAGSVKFWVILIVEGIVLFSTGVAFLKSRS